MPTELVRGLKAHRPSPATNDYVKRLSGSNTCSRVLDLLGDLFAQRRLGGGSEAGQRVVVDGDFLLAAAELAQPEPLVDECPSNLFASGKGWRRAYEILI